MSNGEVGEKWQVVPVEGKVVQITPDRLLPLTGKTLAGTDVRWTDAPSSKSELSVASWQEPGSSKHRWDVITISSTESKEPFCTGLRLGVAPATDVPAFIPFVWANGVTHRIVGSVRIGGYEITSSSDAPLRFVIDHRKGYVYRSGMGEVRSPGGDRIVLDGSRKDVILGKALTKPSR